ncbi:LysR substrate-binding domain-containing protein [Roseibium salinum]|uniref:LysR substrate-binding domain-containing protein n=1 Tax=Roseibium salinum TaxID=1604349 RepID=A0ABT3QWE5_9HYPH|nr:LysR substrate-binding domain-containing protein [Roseibium sp. DSM 29163]MCX2721231.1 LysR substrate-binding domain-containing protein [Roseibium sp. DSM 29163]MDN3722698.1 LysR substrate-binding domain-containing protein [Roseibium salinum]
MNRLPPLRLLVTFDAVQRLGSMQLAASELNVTRPAVTQAIKALEDQIGVPLMDRRCKPSVPTEAGERLARATRNGLSLIADSIEEIRYSAGLAGRQITVSCTLGMATHWLMPRLPQFYARHPDILVNLQTPPSDLPAFATGVDIALRYGGDDWRDGETVKLFDEQACPVGRAGLIEAAMAHPEGLLAAPLIHVRSPHAHHWASWPEYFAARELGRPHGPMQVFDNYIQAVQAALDGRGVMLGWRSITESRVQDGTFAALPDGGCDFGTAYWVTCSRDSQRKPAARAFMEWITETSVRGNDLNTREYS